MRTGKGVTRFGVIEPPHDFPIIRAVALLAFRTEVSLMGILMARHA